VVIESFGIGNIPTEGPFFEWVSQNSKLPEEERKVLINISQVFQSVIKNIYETGQMAFDLGMIPGSDMTCEAAISKLSYLVSKGCKTYR
jgi:lysophospholipase